MEESRSILRQYWGYDDFRSPQKEIIQSVLQGRDTIALLPTGGGKSICYQIPALMLPGKTIIISPLIALMQDQVDNLMQRGIIAKSLNSNLDYRQIDSILDRFVYGDLRLLYISPERIATELFSKRIQNAKLSLIAVDEAHCISQWGYDFRPAYFNIPRLREIHPDVPVMALTATATPKVLDDIREKLLLKSPVIFKKSFARDNLSLTVVNTDDKAGELLRILSRVRGCTIIYVRNRRETIETAQWLTQHGHSVVSYHGGMERGLRDRNQQAWMNNKARIIVCTNAFGMGIDKADVRLVVHMDVPPSLEEYYQEAGRAGRDGKDSWAVMVLDEGDISAAQSNLEEQFPSIESIAGVYDRLCRYFRVAYGSGPMESYDFNIIEFSEYLGKPVKTVFHTLSILEKEGWIAFSEAFREPSKVLVLADAEMLEFIGSGDSLKKNVLVHLLRKYEGLFMDYTKIDETRVAQEMKIDEPQLIHYLHILRSENIIDYQPRSSKPQVTFIQERPQPESFSIDRKAYQLRKKLASDRLKAMVTYVTQEEKCRQSVVIEYFGENGSKPCEKCDICQGRSETTLSPEQLRKVLDHLLGTIEAGRTNIKAYANLYPFNKRRRIIRALRQFEAEGQISIDNAGIINKKP